MYILKEDVPFLEFAIQNSFLKCPSRDFPGVPVVKTPFSQCRGHGFDPWVRELRSHMPHGVAHPSLKIRFKLSWQYGKHLWFKVTKDRS